MKLKELQSLLQDVQPFAKPKAELEQYPTNPHLAACMLYTIDSAYDDVAGRNVVDLGSGTGMLSIGCALLGASHVVGLELDTEAIQVAIENLEQFEDDELSVDFVNCNLLDLLPEEELQQQHVQNMRGVQQKTGRKDKEQRKAKSRQGRKDKHSDRKGGRYDRRSQEESEDDDDEDENENQDDSEDNDNDDSHVSGSQEGPSCQHNNNQNTASASAASTSEDSGALQPRIQVQPQRVGVLQQLQADTVVMNPPFGTKAQGIDMMFLSAALRICKPGGVVYSLHKSSTRSYIHTAALRQFGAAAADVVAELKYDLPATMHFHKQKSVDIEVDLWRIQVPRQDADEEQEQK